jgi:ribokinase
MMHGRVVVVGSLNADLVVTVPSLPRPGETIADGAFASHGGGKGANQAVAAARMGARVDFVGAVGTDDLGDEGLRALADEGVGIGRVARIDRVPTGVALIMVDNAGENSIAVASGANAELEGKHVAAALQGLLGSERPAGVLLLGHEVPSDAVMAGAYAAHVAGWTILLNPAPARELPSELTALGPLLTPNATEAAALTGEDDPELAAGALAALTGAAVLITLGASGALLLDAGSRLHLPAGQVTPVDTTGAGDTVNGVLAAELAAGRPLAAAARTAMAAAAQSTLTTGARAGMPRRDEL